MGLLKMGFFRVFVFSGFLLLNFSSLQAAAPRWCASSLTAIALSFAGERASASVPFITVTSDTAPRAILTGSYETPAALHDGIRNLQEAFRNEAAFYGGTSLYDPGYFPADQWRRPETSSPWLQVSGGWNSVVLTAPREMPWQHRFGTEVIYDHLLNVNDLFQYTVIDWSQSPFRVRVTHYAWVRGKKDQWTIPDKGSGALVFAAAGALGWRKRRGSH